MVVYGGTRSRRPATVLSVLFVVVAAYTFVQVGADPLPTTLPVSDTTSVELGGMGYTGR